MGQLDGTARPEDTGARLRAARELAGFSPRDVARAAGISPRELAAAERGRRPLTADELHAVAEALSVDPAMLVADGFSDAEDPRARPVDTTDTERRRNFPLRKRIEDSWTDVRAEMDDLIRASMRLTTIGSGDDVREMVDSLELEIRRVKSGRKFLSAVARHERLVADARSGANKRNGSPARAQ